MKCFKRAAASVIAVAILFNCVVFCYAAYDAVKVTDTTDYKLNYSGNTRLSVKNGTYTKGTNTYGAKVYTVEASPSSVSVVATNGKSLYGAKTLTDIIAQTDTGGKSVAAAINADFFSTTTGLPLGVQITNGRLVATNLTSYDAGAGRVSIGFKADGSTVFGVPEFDIKLSIDDYSIKIDKINRQNTYTDHVLLFTSDYGDKTHWGVTAKGTGYDVIVLETEKAIGVDGKFKCYYKEYHQNITTPLDIKKDKIYICAPTGMFGSFSPPPYLEYGGEKVYTDESFVTVTEKTGKWKGVVNAVGGGNFLINNGVIRYPSTYDSAIKNTYTSRTAFGVKADGTYVFYAAERNKPSGVSGVWMDAVAQAMFDMGCVYAVNLDGGGSTTVAANAGYGLAVQNKCQDGAQRKIANALLLLSNESAPEIIEDFEEKKELTDIYSGTNLMTASVISDSAYTGAGALKLDYALKGVGNSVGVGFSPIDVTKYKMLSVAVNEMGSGVRVDARLKNGDKEFTRAILKGNEKSYLRGQVDVSDATQLVGFEIVYELAAKNRNTVLIDRIVGLGADMSADTLAPTLTVKNEGGKLNISATEPVFDAGIDTGGAEVTVDGDKMIRTNTIDTALYSNDKIHKARVDVTDTLGNRAVAYQLFKTANYAAPLPFSDMSDSKWDALAIRYCYENGIINGVKENGTLNFKGADNITRAEFCVMVVNRKKLDINSYVGITLPYADAEDIPKWALLYIKAAYAEGIMTGSKAGDSVVFNPNADITRQEAASALDRLIEKDSRISSSVSFTDQSTFAKWARKYIESASTQGLFMGDKDGRFNAEKNLTRSESAVVMSKL